MGAVGSRPPRFFNTTALPRGIELDAGPRPPAALSEFIHLRRLSLPPRIFCHWKNAPAEVCLRGRYITSEKYCERLKYSTFSNSVHPGVALALLVPSTSYLNAAAIMRVATRDLPKIPVVNRSGALKSGEVTRSIDLSNPQDATRKLDGGRYNPFYTSKVAIYSKLCSLATSLMPLTMEGAGFSIIATSQAGFQCLCQSQQTNHLKA